MGVPHTLSVPEISRLCGRSRAWGAAKARENAIPANRVPGYKQARYYNSARLRKYCDEERQLSEKPKARPSRAGQMSRRRQEKIKKLLEILRNKTEVSAEEKKAALSYYNCLQALWWVRFSKDTPLRIPLIEGIQALYQSKLLFGDLTLGGRMQFHIDLVKAIKRLPTRLETRPQTEQSSLNVSA
jgi:hypothetical protein